MNKSIAFLIFSLLLLQSCSNNEITKITPTIAPITEAVFASGHIEAKNQFILTANNDGYLKEIAGREGDIVAKGQILFYQDNALAAIESQTAREALSITKKQTGANSSAIKQLETQLQTADQKLQLDKTNLERMQRLYATNSVSKIDLENAQLAFTNSSNTIKEIKQNIEATRLNLKQNLITGTSQQQIKMANDLYYQIKAPEKSKIFSILKKKGEYVRKGEALAVLGDTVTTNIILYIDEASIAKVKLNQVVLIELNTMKGKTLKAHVSTIYPLFDEPSQSFKVEASFDSPVHSIINGTLLQANIIISKKPAALLIPRDYLIQDNKVIIQTNDEQDTIKVKTGIISNEWVEILQGLTKSQTIIRVNH